MSGAVAYSAAGEGLRATADLTTAIELDRDFADAYARRGLLAALSGGSKGLIDLEKAVELDRVYRQSPVNRRNPLWKVTFPQSLTDGLRDALLTISSGPSRDGLESIVLYFEEQAVNTQE